MRERGKFNRRLRVGKETSGGDTLASRRCLIGGGISEEKF